MSLLHPKHGDVADSGARELMLMIGVMGGIVAAVAVGSFIAGLMPDAYWWMDFPCFAAPAAIVLGVFWLIASRLPPAGGR